MNAKRRFKKILQKGVRKVRNRKGFGVHSPFAYSLITQVIGENNSYYAYTDIRKLRKMVYPSPYVLSGKQKLKRPSLKQTYLLYRLVNRFQPRCVLELNNNGGLSAVAMGLVDSSIHVLSLYETEIAKEYSAKLIKLSGLDNIDIEEAEKHKELKTALTGSSADFIVINPNWNTWPYDELYRQLKTIINAHSVIVIKGIHGNKEARLLWSKLKSDDNIRVTMDLLDTGLCFCNEKLYKQHYKVSF